MSSQPAHHLAQVALEHIEHVHWLKTKPVVVSSKPFARLGWREAGEADGRLKIVIVVHVDVDPTREEHKERSRVELGLSNPAVQRGLRGRNHTFQKANMAERMGSQRVC